MTIQNKRLKGILFTVAVLLLIPFIAMQFTDQVKWGLFDFVIMGVLLLGTGLMIEFVLRRIKEVRYRIVVVAILLILFLLTWAELAVGIFGTRFAGS